MLKEIEPSLVMRFMKYVRYWTESDPKSEKIPSTEGQWDLARVLQSELLELGLSDVSLTDNCYVIARLPASFGHEKTPSVGFMAHMDTSSDVSGKDVKPILVKSYNGKKIAITDAISLDPSIEEGLANQIGQDLIHADGSTLLGADNKAGIAEIMAAVEYLIKHPEISHGPIEIIFTPDEETGRGLSGFPLEKIKSKACYTLDGGPCGEIETECFNAWKAEVEFQGKVIHVGAARGILANAALMAANFSAMLPRSESPESTDGYYGYYCLKEITGDLENAKIEILLRDFESEGMARRVAALESFAKAVQAQFPGGKVIVKAKKQYANMKNDIDKNPEVLVKLKKAMENAEISWKLKPIRGGTDGARLTEMGIPTPNIFTGGRNFHSRLEWISVKEMCNASRVVIELAKLWGEK